MATAKTWLWILVALFGLCVISLVATAGAGVYFVSHHIAMQKTAGPSAVRAFDLARARFGVAQPLIEVDALDRPHDTRRLADLPTARAKPSDLHVLAWNPEDGRLARVTLPFWLLRFGGRRMEFLNDVHNFDFERLNLDTAELERIGPALVLDYRTPSGQRVLIWTQ